MDLASKMAWIVNLCGKSSGFADFENTVDRGSAVISDADSGLCLSYVRTLDPKQNLEPRSFFSLDRCVNDLVQIISFFKKNHLNSNVRLWNCTVLLSLSMLPSLLSGRN